MQCCVCKLRQRNFVYKKTITNELASTWALDTELIERFNHRESDFCHRCGCSSRSRAIASAIMLSYPESNSSCFTEWVEWAKNSELSIAEINYCGHLHQYLAKIPHTTTSQYREHTIRALVTNWIKGIRVEDIMNLKYQSNSFDLVLHSEVLEHVSDTSKALEECKRVLKPGGLCLFTVPLIPGRKTKKKAHIDSKTNLILYYGGPSYHGGGEKDNLVFWEFGWEIIKKHRLKIIYSDPKKYLWVLKLEKEGGSKDTA